MFINKPSFFDTPKFLLVVVIEIRLGEVDSHQTWEFGYCLKVAYWQGSVC